MRVTRFREVLWQTARKIGLDPDKDNFLVNEAIPLGESLSQWVRRTYPSRDWPEWTKVVQTNPVNHIVPYDPIPVSPAGVTHAHIFRVFNVYLVDPTTTDAPVTTDYTLREEGIHVGFDHGSNVWVKYIEPPPKFTAEQWRPDTNFSRDDVTYSYTTGHVYKSKSNSNLGHDPAVTFSLPAPLAQPPTQLPTEIVQQFSLGNPGVAGQDQIVDVVFTNILLSVGGPIPNPPPLNARFFVEVVDVNGTLIGNATSIANGTDTLDLIVTDLTNQLISALAGFTSVTVNTQTFAIRITDNSQFRVNQAFWGEFAQPNRSVPIRQIQTYIVTVPPTPASPQIIQFPLTEDQVTSGAVYSLNFKDVSGVSHIVNYTAALGDGNQQILTGLITAIQSGWSNDPFFAGVTCTLDTVSPLAQFSTNMQVSLDAAMVLPGSPWWELVPFPTALSDMVERGGYADLLKEWGQTDKGTAEEGQVPQEAGVSKGNYDSMPINPLTNQQVPVSRYKVS